MKQSLTRAPSNRAVLRVWLAGELLVEDRRMTARDQPGLLAKPHSRHARIVRPA